MGDNYRIGKSVGAVGRGAKVGRFHHSRVHKAASRSSLQLQLELAVLRARLDKEVESEESAAAARVVGKAKDAAACGDEAGLKVHLAAAGGVALAVAKSLGLPVVIAAIERALGL